MAKSPYIRDVLSEQQLVEDLYVESVNHMGRDVYYLPRTLVSQNKIFGEATRSDFEKAYVIPMYLTNVQAFEGQGDIISKFGIEDRDRATLIVAKREFEHLITRLDSTITRPREGDLIYFPLASTLFEINFVEHESPLYQLGALYSFVLFTEAFSYNNEVFSTGVAEIDKFYTSRKKLAQLLTLSDWTGVEGTTSNFFTGEEVFQVSGTYGIIDGVGISYSQATAKGEVINISGITMTVGNVSGSFVTAGLRGVTGAIQGRSSTGDRFISGTGDADFSTQINIQGAKLVGDNEEIDLDIDKESLIDFDETDPFSEGTF